MIPNDDQALLVLNTLVRTGRDAELGYMAAADGVADPDLVQLFAGYAVQRAKDVVELQDRVRVLRGSPDDNGTIGGEVHRAWMGLRAAMEANEIHGILAECVKGEEAAVIAYRQALATRDIDQATRDLIQRQYEQVQAAHDRVRQLRDSATYPHR
ncbi:MAG: PA2169 family four-helix-bundle protein [Opitutaceae bacterium]